MSIKTENLRNSKKMMNNEFYTLEDDVEYIVETFRDEFKDKILYFNCDDYRFSNFYKVFKNRFEELKLKGIYSSNLDIGDGSYLVYYDGDNESIRELKNGSYDSDELIDVYRNIDIVVTNPPFLNKNDYMEYIYNFNLDYILILPITLGKGFLGKIKDKNKMNYIYEDRKIKDFLDGDMELKKSVAPCIIFNSFKSILSDFKNKPSKDLIYEYADDLYEGEKLLNINKSVDVPLDYEGYIAVPVTFKFYNASKNFDFYYYSYRDTLINGENKFARDIIKLKK